MPRIKNRFGLDRDIPDPIKRLIRQRCHFGCVICGRSIVEYEHFNPVFADARAHEAAGICLLCPNCHAKKTRNLLSARRLRAAASDPTCAREGFSFDELEAQSIPPYIIFCGSLLSGCATVISVAGWPLLEVNAPEDPHAPHALSASFFNSQGGPSLLLRHNEWIVLSDQWDAELTSNTHHYPIRRRKHWSALDLQARSGNCCGPIEHARRGIPLLRRYNVLHRARSSGYQDNLREVDCRLLPGMAL
jgi:hypothetical protein